MPQCLSVTFMLFCLLFLCAPLAPYPVASGGGAPMRVGLPLAAVLVRLRTYGLPVRCLSAR
jgi:hypothetical protein